MTPDWSTPQTVKANCAVHNDKWSGLVNRLTRSFRSLITSPPIAVKTQPKDRHQLIKEGMALTMALNTSFSQGRYRRNTTPQTLPPL